MCLHKFSEFNIIYHNLNTRIKLCGIYIFIWITGIWSSDDGVSSTTCSLMTNHFQYWFTSDFSSVHLSLSFHAINIDSWLYKEHFICCLFSLNCFIYNIAKIKFPQNEENCVWKPRHVCLSFSVLDNMTKLWGGGVPIVSKEFLQY